MIDFRLGPVTALALTLMLPLAARAQDDDKAPGQPHIFPCVLKTTEDGFQGDCGNLYPNAPAPVLKLFPTAHVDSVWREDRLAQRVYKGTFTEGKSDVSDLELEIYPGGWGILRTEYGWLPVTGFVAGSDLAFTLDPKHEIAPSALDERILMRALQIAHDGADWNRADNRQCGDTTRWSIYCAIDRATIEVTGAHDHRRPAMEVVRLLIEERTKDKAYQHRLMGYNNDPKTTLDDVQSVFEDALKRLHDEDWLAAHDFVRPDGNGGFTPG